MAVQQIAGFQFMPGRRDDFLAALAKVRKNVEALGATGRIATVTSGLNTGRIVTSTTHADWEALAAYTEASLSNQPLQPLFDVLRSATPAASVVGTFIRNELMLRDGDGAETMPFVSSLSFDVLSDRAAVLAAAGETRDLFEELGSHSRLWVIANGEQTGRVTITSEFEHLGGWARFRAALEQHTASTPTPMARVEGKFQSAGIVHTQAVPA